MDIAKVAAGSWVFPSCQYKPAFMDQKPEKGVPVSIELLSTYPPDTLYSNNVHILVRNAVISTEIMNKVLTIFMCHLMFSNPTIILSRLINMEMFNDSENGDLFLVEVLIKFESNPQEELLISEFVVLGHKDVPPSLLCHSADMKMQKDTFVHFLVTHRNFPQMIREFVQNMERVYDESGDENFGIIIVNYVTPLINVLTLLRQSRLKHWSVIDFQGPWEKTAAINIGIDSVKDPNDIIFITDLSIYYPSHLPETIRKHTFQGFSGFAPVIFYFSCHFNLLVDYYGTYSIYGYGLFSLYKSDWEVVGGMDSTRFKGKWGWEDNDLTDRVLTYGYALFRLVIRDFYHQNHTYSGLWDINST
ncbi:Beta-1,4-N-acetyl-galactosaminyl transferase 4 [Oopsacas minuta]|uniref:Hexosyltransferase n=1 Tax=Oopsacas minuta TaxID=111878 RepID=A0AAV7JED2_9METZ|nr:Beta-1,4-N-acetyl-galactosaminyl transferase 4 [Oopsacas minuta]